jgi:pimeloyl-ACP methyl ester carboxylesterase
VLLGPGDTFALDLDRANVTGIVREARNILAHRKNHGVAVATSYWRDRLKDIRTPTLVMHGTHDYCLPLDHAKALANEIPGARLVVVDGMGHVLSLTSRYWHVFADALIAHTASGTNPLPGDHRLASYAANMTNGTITMNDGRTVGFADYGSSDQVAVVWCHGGPGNRLEPLFVADAAARAGLRLIGIDRPGYGRSSPQPGRTIGGWVPDALAVLDHLGIDRFVALGVSTGGAYALALASHSPRAIGAVACCALSDMRWAEGKAMNVSCHPFWNVRSRDESIALAIDVFGEHGEKLVPPHGPVGADAADAALYATPDFLSWWTWCVEEMFTNGLTGYVDDRLADTHGWGTFDVTRITCPVTVLHGAIDGMVPVANAHHTAAIVPGATLRIFEDLGHVSIVSKAVEVTSELLNSRSLR